MKKRTFTALPVLSLIFSFILLAACSSSSSSSGGGGGGGGDTTPETPTTYTINAMGGIGGSNGGDGGSGGGVYMNKVGGSGEIAVLSSGQVDATFTVPTSTPFLGDNVLTVSADTTIDVYTPSDVPPAVNRPYLVDSGSSYLYISDGDTSFEDENPVTGIVINEGVTLTLGLNYANEQAHINIENDIQNNGTLTTKDVDAGVDPTTPRGYLLLNADSYHGTGMILLNGTTAGQRGGSLFITLSGNFTNSGAITTAGADAVDADGGDGGSVDIEASGWISNTGSVTSSGGNASGTAGYGGYSNEIAFNCYYGDLMNSGNLTAIGGDGIDNGGDTAGVSFEVYQIGSMYNSGDINTSGGNAQNGDGGYSGGIYFYMRGLDMLNSGSLTATGGDTSDASGSGGGGGYVEFDHYSPSISSTPSGMYLNAGDTLISGNIDTSGGNAVSTGTGSGGDSNVVYFDVENTNRYGDTSRLVLYGYNTINMSGGDANYPGYGNGIEVYSGFVNESFPPGPITNEADLIAMGGNVSADATNVGTGGEGGFIDFFMGYSLYFAPHDVPVSVTNSGNINVSGGESYNAPSNDAAGGEVFMYGMEGLTNTGSITAVGGNDRAVDGGVNGYGGDGGYVELYADSYTLTNSGNFDSSGGDGEYRGGDAYGIYIYGLDVANTGNLTAEGGNATATLSGSYGGDGDWVELYYRGTSSGTISCTGGTGETAGDDGEGYVFEQRVF